MIYLKKKNSFCFRLWKAIMLIFFGAVFFASCNKDESSKNTEALPPSVELFSGQYNKNTQEISLNWRYIYASQIRHFELFYAPGQDTAAIIDPWISSYAINSVLNDTSYLFNIRAVDLYGTYSQAEVLYISTSSE
jgi:hypothetical protein